MAKPPKPSEKRSIYHEYMAPIYWIYQDHGMTFCFGKPLIDGHTAAVNGAKYEQHAHRQELEAVLAGLQRHGLSALLPQAPDKLGIWPPHAARGS